MILNWFGLICIGFNWIWLDLYWIRIGFNWIWLVLYWFHIGIELILTGFVLVSYWNWRFWSKVLTFWRKSTTLAQQNYRISSQAILSLFLSLFWRFFYSLCSAGYRVPFFKPCNRGFFDTFWRFLVDFGFVLDLYWNWKKFNVFIKPSNGGYTVR